MNPPAGGDAEQASPGGRAAGEAIAMRDQDAESNLRRGIQLARAGDKSGAYPLLRQAAEADPADKLAWLWLAGVAPTPEESAACLRRVLEIDPNDRLAREGLARMGGRPAATADPTVPSGPARRGRVLIVDDSPTVRRLVTITLERQGYDVLAAEDGMAALARINESLPDLVLLDINMPRMDGFQFCKTVKGSRATRHIPVVMLTGRDGLSDKVRARMVGCEEFLSKPFEPSELTRLVERLAPHADGRAVAAAKERLHGH